MNSLTAANKNGYLLSISIIGALFFIFGFVTWLNGILIPYLQISCELTNFQAVFVVFAFYISYALMALPSSWILEKTGFKSGIMLGLVIMAFGTLIFVPAATMQWWDEDHGLDGFYSITEAGSAFNYYHRKDGKVTGLWKRSLCALSDDGVHFSKPVKSSTLIMAGGKMWGQATEDGRFAICYNPIELDEYRYPLIVISD